MTHGEDLSQSVPFHRKLEFSSVIVTETTSSLYRKLKTTALTNLMTHVPDLQRMLIVGLSDSLKEASHLYRPKREENQFGIHK